MSVTAVSAISLDARDASQQQDGDRQALLNLQGALSSGNLAAAQRALVNFQQNLQSSRPRQNGVQVSAEVNPQSARRADMQALQSALDSGDLAMAEQAFVRLQQDSRPSGASSNPASLAQDSFAPSASDPSAQSKGGLVDFTA